MAKIKNPRKKFLCGISFINHPIDQYLFQKVNLPDKDLEVVKHGDVNRDVKTAGRVNLGNLTAEKMETTSGSDTWVWDWMASIQDEILGGGLTPEEYWETIIVTEFAEDGTSVLNQWTCFEVFPVKLNGRSLERMSSDNTMDSIEFAVGTCEKI